LLGAEKLTEAGVSHASPVPAPPESRVRLDLLRELVPPKLDCHFFICGPGISTFERASAKAEGVEPTPRFLESVLADLGTFGVQRDQIKRESYGTA